MQPNFLIRLSAIVTFVFSHVALADTPDVEAAAKDRADHFAAADWQSIFYLTTRPHAGDNARDLERAIKLTVASNTIQPVIERSLPVKVASGLYRLDLRDLRWRYEDWAKIATNRNPYSLGTLPLVVRADWLLVEISDMQESDTYQRLMFGGDKLPKTREDVLKFFGVGNNPQQTFGLIEGQSEVSKQGTRRVESLPIARGYAWVTKDVLKLDAGRDPVEHPDGNSPFDGEEGIIGVPKLSSTTGKRGALQWYWLNNGKGALVNRAPVDLVEDSTHFRGYREIRVPGSCIQCHADGLNQFKRNEFRELVKSGVNVFAGSKQRQELEAFHLSDLKTEIARANDDFQTMVELACGDSTPDPKAKRLTSAEVVKSFQAAVNRYDAPLGLQETAEELGVPVAEWTKTLATNPNLPARFASLPHAGRIPRAAWEQGYQKAYYATHAEKPVVQVVKEEPKVEQPKEEPKEEKPKEEPKPAKPVSNNGWRMRLFYPPGSETGQLIDKQLTDASKLGDFCREHGFQSFTTDTSRFEEWRQLGYRQNELTLVLVNPNGHVVLKQHSIAKEPEKILAELRGAVEVREDDGFGFQQFNSGNRR